MGSKGDYWENIVIGGALGGIAITLPTPTYIHLFTATPSDVNNTGTAVSGGSYAPLSLANTSTNWNTPSSGSVSNKIDFVFATPTASWGVVTHFAIKDGSAGSSNTLYWGALTASKTIESGDPVSFPAGSLVIDED